MLKKKWKMIVLVTILSLMVNFHFSSVFATVDDVASENQATTKSVTEDIMPISEDDGDTTSNEAVTTSEESGDTTSNETATTTEEQEIHEDDLYLIGDSVVMDKLVDGNAYILANNVEITGQVNGNLYVCANKVTFRGSYIRYSIYACANTIEFDAACNDLYTVANSMNVTYDSYIVRDIHATANSMNFIGAVGRNANIAANSLNLKRDTAEGEEEQLALIYGNLNYSSPSEITIPEGIVEGDINYTSLQSIEAKTSVTTTIYDYIISLLNCLVYTFVIFFLMLWLTPKFEKKSTEFVSGKMGIGLGIGIISIFAAFVIALVLLISVVATPVAFAFIAAYILLVSTGFATVSICFANKLAKDGKLGKKLGMLIIVTIILWALTQIPFIGKLIWVIITLSGFGTLLFYSFTKNKDNKKVEETTQE